MAWRVIARIGYSDDGNGSKLRNHVGGLLTSAGFTNTLTGTWEIAAVNEAAAVTLLNQMMTVLGNPSSHVASLLPNARLKHLWLYLDEGPVP